MVIRGVDKSKLPSLYGQKRVNEQRPKNGAFGGSDTVEISDAARELQSLVKETAEIDDIRQEKIDALKDKVQSGEYYVPSYKIADAIMKYMSAYRGGGNG